MYNIYILLFVRIIDNTFTLSAGLGLEGGVYVKLDWSLEPEGVGDGGGVVSGDKSAV